MQDYISLINFLKENDENIKKNLETLKFGCVIYKKRIQQNIEDYFNEESEEVDGLELPDTIEEKYFRVTKEGDGEKFLKDIERNKSIIEFKVIGNNLDYHHIMMYCENNYLGFTLYYNGMEIWMKKKQSMSFYTELNNTKPFHQQDDLVYKQLLEYFNSLK